MERNGLLVFTSAFISSLKTTARPGLTYQVPCRNVCRTARAERMWESGVKEMGWEAELHPRGMDQNHQHQQRRAGDRGGR